MDSRKTSERDTIPYGKKLKRSDLDTIVEMRNAGAYQREIADEVGTSTANIAYTLKKLENAGKYDNEHSSIEVPCCPVCRSCKIYPRMYQEYKYRCPDCGHVGNNLSKKPRWLRLKNVPKREKKTFRPSVENCHAAGCPRLKYINGRPRCDHSGKVPGHMQYCSWRDNIPVDVLRAQALVKMGATA
jgi:hypothetical protein